MKNAGTGIAFIAALAIQTKAVAQETYRGVRVEPEFRCAPYDRDEYSYPQSVESQIIAGIGKIYGPYTGQCFATSSETDIEHIVPLSEAHDSGLCCGECGDKGPVCTGCPQPDAGKPASEPVRERREGRRRVAAWAQRMLVREQNA